jgi:hypothetical protein
MYQEGENQIRAKALGEAELKRHNEKVKARWEELEKQAFAMWRDWLEGQLEERGEAEGEREAGGER